jgi:hypothetical protein
MFCKNHTVLKGEQEMPIIRVVPGSYDCTPVQYIYFPYTLLIFSHHVGHFDHLLQTQIYYSKADYQNIKLHRIKLFFIICN